MPVFRLHEEISFPPPHLASSGGLLAVGGDLSVQRLLAAYSQGIFPWFSQDDPLLWWSPNPRMVLFPRELHVSRRMNRVLRRSPFALTMDHAFERVIAGCAQPRADGFGTWITPQLQEAFLRLHHEGHAHSMEVWHKEELAAGIYGISLGSCFFGESMFSVHAYASRFGFIHLVRWLEIMGFRMIDCQVETPHLKSFGARTISRQEFMLRLKRCVRERCLRGDWGRLFNEHFPVNGRKGDLH